jgi:hypothetical protein
MPTYSFATDIEPGDAGQTDWANDVGLALNTLGPLVGNIPVYLGASTPTTITFLQFKPTGAPGLVELWIEDGT